MTRRRAIKSVLHNFLGTYTSRYSDYDGYWLFGFLAGEIERVTIDLMSPTTESIRSTPMTVAVQLALRKFVEQCEKAGFALSLFQHAELEIMKHPASVTSTVNNHQCQGYNVTFQVKAVSDHGRPHKDDVTLFVAPHDPAREYQSTRRR